MECHISIQHNPIAALTGGNSNKIMKSKTQKFVIYRIAEFGDYIVYRRGAWAKRERLPLYLVSRQSDGRDLEQFRRKKSALNWAEAQSKNQTKSSLTNPNFGVDADENNPRPEVHQTAPATAAHTPRQWEAGRGIDNDIEPRHCVVSAQDERGLFVRRIANVYLGRTDAEREANARLIAASPDLLAALEVLVSLRDHPLTVATLEVAYRNARAALAKARQ